MESPLQKLRERERGTFCNHEISKRGLFAVFSVWIKTNTHTLEKSFFQNLFHFVTFYKTIRKSIKLNFCWSWTYYFGLFLGKTRVNKTYQNIHEHLKKDTAENTL